MQNIISWRLTFKRTIFGDLFSIMYNFFLNIFACNQISATWSMNFWWMGRNFILRVPPPKFRFLKYFLRMFRTEMFYLILACHLFLKKTFYGMTLGFLLLTFFSLFMFLKKYWTKIRYYFFFKPPGSVLDISCSKHVERILKHKLCWYKINSLIHI